MGTTDAASTADFYASLPTLGTFSQLADASAYASVPQGWSIGLADIVDSTGAIAAGRYKEVNTAAAAVIAALSNALPGRQIPFVFGGDGASFAIDPCEEAIGRAALASTAAWIDANFGLRMRVAMVPVASIRDAGLDLKLARFEVAPGLSYAMFSGGGLGWAEARMKAGDFAVVPEDGDARPDLTGLSCRFSEIPARNGTILSLIVMPFPDAAPETFGTLVRSLLEIADAEADGGRPIPAGGPALTFTFRGYMSETRTSGAKSGRSFWRSAASVGLRTVLAYLTFASRRTVGDFDPGRYRREIVRNSDFRKFDDGLRMTLDCTLATADRIEALLGQAAKSGVAIVGTHRQAAALMTCFVPSPSRSDHVHFVDGASGGYAMAAQSIKDAGRIASVKGMSVVPESVP